MSQLTDKYGDIYILAEKLGGKNLKANEENGHMTISGVLPTAYAVNQVWDKAKQIDPGLDDGDLTLNFTAERSDIYGEYEVQSGDTLSGIARKISGGKLTYQQIFEANRDILSDPDKIHPGQKLKIPHFSSGQSV
ncbi:MAG TPA: LysM peptidoglycan-binding domain-containing protein [Blastocatellia bacterium]|nr:LysM peptidoglycan-binding domain-containing protein [Blastocatellia bacterium]